MYYYTILYILGDLIDGYCIKTFNWYESKIIDVHKDDKGGDRIKVHFLGWNSKYDE